MDEPVASAKWMGFGKWPAPTIAQIQYSYGAQIQDDVSIQVYSMYSSLFDVFKQASSMIHDVCQIQDDVFRLGFVYIR